MKYRCCKDGKLSLNLSYIGQSGFHPRGNKGIRWKGEN